MRVWIVLILSVFVLGCTKEVPREQNAGETRADTAVALDQPEAFRTYLSALNTRELGSVSKGVDYFTQKLPGQDKKLVDACFIELDGFIDRVVEAENETFQTRTHEEQNGLYEAMLDPNLEASPQDRTYLKTLSDNCLVLGVEEGSFFVKKDESAVFKKVQDQVTAGMKAFLAQKEKEYREGFWSDGGLVVTPKTLAERVVFWEEFMKQNEGFVMISDGFRSEVQNLTQVLFTGVDNTPPFDYETHLLHDLFKEAYQFLIEQHPESEAGKMMKPYYELLANNGFKESEESKKYIEAFIPPGR
jgi:hypothetical protein